MSASEPVADASPTVPTIAAPTQPAPASAVADARRIYLGNLPRSVKPEDVTAFLKDFTVYVFNN